MSFYARLNATARRLIAKYGKSATLVRLSQSGPAHNPTITETEYTITLADIGYSVTNRDQTLVQVGDKQGIISTAGETPLFEDKIEIDGQRYSFVDRKPLNPGGTTLLFDYHVRK